MKTPHATLIPLTHGGELLVAHRHTGGLLLAQRTGRAGNFRIDVIGVVAAEDVDEFRAALAPAPVLIGVDLAAGPDSSAVTHWHATTPAEVARHNPGLAPAAPAPIWQPTPPAPVTGGDVICSILFFAGAFFLIFITA